MSGQSTVLVDPPSAAHSQECESEPINRTHSELVKYSHQDEDYQTVLRHLSTFRQNACSVIQERFNDGDAGQYPYCLTLTTMVPNRI